MQHMGLTESEISLAWVQYWYTKRLGISDYDSVKNSLDTADYTRCRIQAY